MLILLSFFNSLSEENSADLEISLEEYFINFRTQITSNKGQGTRTGVFVAQGFNLDKLEYSSQDSEYRAKNKANVMPSLC